MKRLLVLKRILLVVVLMTASLSARSWKVPVDILEAQELCNEMDLRPVEGLWLCPEDDVVLMIMRHNSDESKYLVTVVESSDCSLIPGMEIGHLSISPDPNKFKLKLFTKVKKGVLQLPCEAAATYSPNNEALTIEKPSIKISFQPGRLLPYFWRTARITVKNPADRIPEGMIKIYPTFDNNSNSLKRHPRYL